MHNTMKRFILTGVEAYLEELIAACNFKQVSIEFYPLSDQVLNSCFLRMIGAIEQKILNIKWFMGFNDLDARNSFQENFSRQATGEEALNAAYNLFIDRLTDLDSKIEYAKLWEHYNTAKNAQDIVGNLFNGSIIVNHTHAAFHHYTHNHPLTFFKRWETCTQNTNKNHTNKTKARLGKHTESMKQSFNAIVKKINSTKRAKAPSLSSDNSKKGISSCLQLYYSELMQYRHMLAHNFNSHRQNLPLIKEISSELFPYNNPYYRFMLCIYLDQVLMQIFSDFIKLQEKYMA